MSVDTHFSFSFILTINSLWFLFCVLGVKNVKSLHTKLKYDQFDAPKMLDAFVDDWLGFDLDELRYATVSSIYTNPILSSQ